MELVSGNLWIESEEEGGKWREATVENCAEASINAAAWMPDFFILYIIRVCGGYIVDAVYSSASRPTAVSYTLFLIPK